MLFNSFHFVLFFPVAVLVYFALPQRVRWAWLLLASYYFYMAWKPAYVVIVWLLTAIDYVAGRAIGGASTIARRRLFLGVSVASNLSLLFVFKYLNFAGATLARLFGLAGVAIDPPFLDVVLPLGISFHTFQALAYTIDVYRGRREPERDLGRFALFIAFFPQMVAGPIERAAHMLPQLAERHELRYDLAVSGLRQMAWGFFKKVVVADRVAEYVNFVYEAPRSHSGLHALVATYLFAVQIYCDFSGYSDIALGAARVMGFELSTNFVRPYLADSVREFWRRWHVTLSSWFRDYVYVPLGGSRSGLPRQTRNLAVVFLLSGLWHGASWTYVVWGALHGFYVIVEVLVARARGDRVDRSRSALARVARTVVTFHLALVAWVFFRASTLADAWRVLSSVATRFDLAGGVALKEFDATELWISVALVAFLACVEIAEERGFTRERFAALPAWARWSVYYAAALAIILFGRFDARTFIYFQF